VGGVMSIVKYTEKERDLLARLMRAEAVGEGNLGMLMVGNVVVNRAIANCLTFKNITSIYDAIYQENQFSGTNSSLFYSNPTTKEKQLANRVIRGEYFYPATNALWFYAPSSGTSCKDVWYDQALAGKYKNHCFYRPAVGVCSEII
jgi:N-acetylmuramoyl-L-alanine amidase